MTLDRNTPQERQAMTAPQADKDERSCDIELPVSLCHANEPLANTGDYIGYTWIEDRAGVLVAEWVDASDAQEEIAEQLVEMLNATAPLPESQPLSGSALDRNTLLEAAKVAENTGTLGNAQTIAAELRALASSQQDTVCVPREPNKEWFNDIADRVGSGKHGPCDDLDDLAIAFHGAMLAAAQEGGKS